MGYCERCMGHVDANTSRSVRFWLSCAVAALAFAAYGCQRKAAIRPESATGKPVAPQAAATVSLRAKPPIAHTSIPPIEALLQKIPRKYTPKKKYGTWNVFAMADVTNWVRQNIYGKQCSLSIVATQCTVVQPHPRSRPADWLVTLRLGGAVNAHYCGMSNIVLLANGGPLGTSISKGGGVPFSFHCSEFRAESWFKATFPRPVRVTGTIQRMGFEPRGNAGTPNPGYRTFVQLARLNVTPTSSRAAILTDMLDFHSSGSFGSFSLGFLLRDKVMELTHTGYAIVWAKCLYPGSGEHWRARSYLLIFRLLKVQGNNLAMDIGGSRSFGWYDPLRYRKGQLGRTWAEIAEIRRAVSPPVGLFGANGSLFYYVPCGSPPTKAEIGRAKSDTGFPIGQERMNRLEARSPGHPRLMDKIGRTYIGGLGVPQNYSMAMTWFRKGARAGDSRAMLDVGLLYADGEGVRRNYPTAVAWLKKASAAGDGNAMCILGMLYGGHPTLFADGGIGSGDAPFAGFPQEEAKAMVWYHKAAAAGNAHAMFKLATYDLKRNDRPQAGVWMHKAVAAGSAEAKAYMRLIRGDPGFWK